MNYLGMPSADLLQQGAIHTAKEISQQPELWKKIRDVFEQERVQVNNFFDQAVKNAERIILTGAGSSAFIGTTLRGIFQQATHLITEAIPTTDIVTHPLDYLQPGQPTIIISFARSGNSPESVAALALADEICKNCYHFIITCNKHGQLAQYAAPAGKYTFILPPEANDKSLAMTSSFTGMLLAGMLLAKINTPGSNSAAINVIANKAAHFIAQHHQAFRNIAATKFERAIFLGGGPLLGIATESHLKVQELTDGKVICKYDSYLAFRHGPKAAIDSTTLLVYLLSDSNYAYQYERDLQDDILKNAAPMLQVGISAHSIPDSTLQHMFSFCMEKEQVDEDFILLCYVIPGQLIGFYKSLQLGLKPDQPSERGVITRIVEGVHIYELPMSF